MKVWPADLLDDLDFADDLTLLLYSQHQRQEKTNIGKGKVLKVNTDATTLITMEGEALE